MEAENSLAAARVRARAAWEALPELTPDAWSWFEESGPNHFAKHVHDLSAWLVGATSDHDIGAMLQRDAEAWVAFGAVLEAADPSARDEEGWSVTDVCFHLAAWFDNGADAWSTAPAGDRRGGPMPIVRLRRSMPRSSRARAR
jgi:hypothetical protein